MKYSTLMVAVCAMLIWSCSPKVTTTPQPQPPKSPTPVKPIPTTNVSKGLIAHYPLDGDANDVVNELNGKLYGPTLTSDRKNKPDSALNFDGVDDYIDLGTYSEFEFTTDYSISLWIYYPGGKQRCSVLNKRQTVMPYAMYSLAINSDGISGRSPGDKLIFVNIPENGKPAKSVSNKGFQLTEGWHHITIINEMNGSANMYVDNQFMGSGTNGGIVKLSRIPLLIGKAVGNSRMNNLYFKGKIDEIRFYDRILNKQEIEQLYTN